MIVSGESRTSWVPIFLGVPQGCVLGPLLFILYTADIPTLFSKYSASGHLFADDVQAYVHGSPFSQLLLASKIELLGRMKHWPSPSKSGEQLHALEVANYVGWINQSALRNCGNASPISLSPGRNLITWRTLVYRISTTTTLPSRLIPHTKRLQRRSRPTHNFTTSMNSKFLKSSTNCDQLQRESITYRTGS